MRSLSIITLAMCISVLLCCDLQAGWQGFPLEEQTNWWGTLQSTYKPLSQTYSAIVERCTFTGVEPPQWSTVLHVDDATGGVYQITVTNALGPVVYAHGTAFPFVTRGMLAEFDSVIEALVTNFVSTNIALDGTRFSTNESNTIEPSPLSDARYTLPQMFRDTGVGLVYSTVTNTGGTTVTNHWAKWTRSPERRWNETLIEQHWSAEASNWVTVGGGPVEWSSTNIPDAWIIAGEYYPVLQYWPTNESISVDLTGRNTDGEGVSETLAGGGVSLVQWQSITGTPAVAGFSGTSTGAWWRLAYTNNIVVYGARPYWLYAKDLDERYRVLNAMRYTAGEPALPGDITDGHEWRSRAESSTNTWSGLRSLAEAAWAQYSTNSVDVGGLISDQYWLQKTFPSPATKNVGLFGQHIKWKTAAITANTNVQRRFLFAAWFSEDVSTGQTWEFADFGLPFRTNQWTVFDASGWTYDTNPVVSAWFPCTPGSVVPASYAALPETTNGYPRFRRSQGDNAHLRHVIEWDFQYK